MIKILIVDDNAIKIKAIRSTLLENTDIKDEDISVCNDKNSTRVKLLESQFDLMILDLSLPERFGDDPEVDGGISILEEINIDPSINLPFHIIGLTAYPDLRDQFLERFSNYLWQLIVYEEQYSTWQNNLKNYTKYLIKSKRELKNPSNVKYDYDLAIVCALTNTELEQVLKLEANWAKYCIPNDHTIYHQGVLKKGKKQIRVIACAADQMGLTSCALLCEKVINNFRPKVLAMTGIAGGIKNKGNYGDILVAELSWDYGSGKVSTKDGQMHFKQDPRPIPLDPDFKAIIQDEEASNEITDAIQKKWNNSNGTKLSSSLKVVLGPVASGSYVIENIEKVYEVVDQQRKLTGFDMETYAVYCAAYYATKPRPRAISIKSICDFGDEHKDDQYQRYAAFTSANFLYEFALKYL